jgi:phosphoribosylanthranilate isomerase
LPDAKICGITSIEVLDAAIEGGARFVGFVTYPKSLRYLNWDKYAAFMAHARGRVETVLVTVNADDAHFTTAMMRAQPDWIQLHGTEGMQRAAEVRPFARRGLIKAVGVARREDIMAAAVFDPVVDMYLFEARAPAEGPPGGNGLAFDWGLMAGAMVARPWLLAGGLTPGNVKEAIRVSGADLVDVSSGVESAPGVKDPHLIAQFLAAAEV